MVEHRHATPAEREQRLARASLRAARVISDMYRETKSSDTRLLDWLIPSELVVVGRSRAFDQNPKQGWREHVVPRLAIIKACHAMVEAGRSDEDVADYIREHTRIVMISREEARRLDRPRHDGGSKQAMPADWKVGENPYRRLEDAGIDWTETGLAAEGTRPTRAAMISSRPETLMADDLYDRDFYLWTQAQAEALRSQGRGANMIDYENLAEEIESLGSSDKAKCASLVFRILQHLYELQATPNQDATGRWRAEIGAFRVDISFTLTKAIRNNLEEELDILHRKAAKVAQARMTAHEPGVKIHSSRRWSLPQVLGEEDDPLWIYEEQDSVINEV